MIEFKFSDFLYPRKLISTYILLRRSEHWDQAQFNKYQSKQLAKLLRFCAKEIPYYGPIFEDIELDSSNIFSSNAMAYLKKLPILDKNTLLEKPHFFIANNFERFHPKPIATSGTTGTPLTIYWDCGSNIIEFCSIQRLWRWAGFHIGQSFLDLRSRVFMNEDNRVIKSNGIFYIRNWKINGLEFSSDLIDDSNIFKYYEILLRFKPRLVRGHPQSMQHLVSLLKKNHLTAWRPNAVTSTSETLHDFQRKLIEEEWHTPILDSYGLKEHNVFIAQCDEGSYHIYPEYGICEILDDDGNPVAPDQEGWIVATGLHNYAQPLLRYNTRDRAILGDGHICSCGRTLPTVKHIIGRIDDCLFTQDGKRYSGMHFAFFGRRGIKKARLIQENLGNVTVELITTSEFDQAECNKLMDSLRLKVGNKIKFVFKYVDSINQEIPGKFKFVVSRLKDIEQKDN